MDSISIDTAKDFIASIPPLYIVLGALTLLSLTRPGQFYAKALGCLICVAFAALFGIFCGLTLTPLGKRTLVNWSTARFFYFLGRSVTGIQVDVEGIEHLGEHQAAVYVQNHQSSMDLLLLGAIFPKNCGILAKSELKYYPFLGQFMLLGQSVFINRANHEHALLTMDHAAETIKKKNMSVWLFPEGTRARLTTADLLPFKKGAFHLAVKAQAPIVPVVVGNYMNIYNSKKHIFSAGRMRVRILPPIETKGRTGSHEDVEALLNTTREAMLKALKEISPLSEVAENGTADKVDT